MRFRLVYRAFSRTPEKGLNVGIALQMNLDRSGEFWGGRFNEIRLDCHVGPSHTPSFC